MTTHHNSYRSLFLRRCTRCGGDMYATRDVYGEYLECLQCGHMVDLVKPQRLRPLRDTASEKEVA